MRCNCKVFYHCHTEVIFQRLDSYLIQSSPSPFGVWFKYFWCEEASSWFGEKIFVIKLSSAVMPEQALPGFKIALQIETPETLGKLCSLIWI